LLRAALAVFVEHETDHAYMKRALKSKGIAYDELFVESPV
jgi:hypothetical protein